MNAEFAHESTSSGPATAPATAWSTPTPALIAVAVGGFALAIAAIFAGDAPSALLVGIAAVGLLGLAGLGFRQRPRLSVEGEHLVVRGLTGPTRFDRADLRTVRVTSFRRLGRRNHMLEIDTARGGSERLYVFGRWDLGAAPADVFDALRAQGFTTDS